MDLVEAGKIVFLPASELTPTLPELFPFGQLAVADFTLPQIFTFMKASIPLVGSAQLVLAP